MITVSIPNDQRKKFLLWRMNTPALNVDRFVFFRLALGLMLLYKFLSLGPYWTAFFSESGYLSREIIQLNNHPGVFSWYLWCDQLAFLTGSTSEQVSIALYLVVISASLAFLFGLLTRFSALILLLANVSLTATFSEYHYGVDHFLSSFLAYALLFPLGKGFSLDALLSRLSSGMRKMCLPGIAPWRAIVVLRIHLCIVYLVGGLTKAGGPTWWNGEAVWKAIHRPGNDLASFLATEIPVREIYVILGAATLLVELFYPIMIWWKRTRALWLWMTLAMHLFIGIVLELHLFATLMIVFNVLAFGSFKNSNPSTSLLNTQS